MKDMIVNVNERSRKFKKVFFFFSIFSLIFSISVFGANLKLRVVTKKANVRLSASLNSDILSKIPLGAILESDGKTGQWFRVKLPADKNGFVISGYIHESTVKVIVGSKKEVAPKKFKKVEKTSKWKKTPKRSNKKSSINSKIEKGVKIGITSSNFQIAFKNEDDSWWLEQQEFSSKKGICFGGFFNYNLTNLFSGQLEFIITKKGAHWLPTSEYWGNTTNDFNITFLEIPILIKLNLTDLLNFSKRINPYVYAGPSYSLKLSGSATYDLDDVLIKSYDFGLILGCGVEFIINFHGEKKFLIEIRQTMGLMESVVWDGNTFKTKTFSIVLGYFL